MRARALRTRNALLLVVVAVAAAGCVSTTPPTNVHQPMTARPEPRPVPPPVGAIYRIETARPLFEDRRARLVGDTLTIELIEKTAASNTSATGAAKSQEIALAAPIIQGVPGKSIQGIAVEADSSSKFSGSGNSNAKNDFTGTITVTVVEVLFNGNLLVSGEKQVAINQSQEYVRFSGIVNPTYITFANTVHSTQVADARIEYKQSGFLNEAQVMGWLARFFLTFLPF
jgi:flagellar L-ring protein precursor FlgH